MRRVSSDIMADLRTDHAGETGAVAIYSSLLRIYKRQEVVSFARRHLETEVRHLETFNQWVPEGRRSRLVFLWRMGGSFLTWITTLFGPLAIFCVIAEIENGVYKHYQGQIERLEGKPRYKVLRNLLAQFQEEEKKHRDEAAAYCGHPGILLTLWCRMIRIVSGFATMFTCRF